MLIWMKIKIKRRGREHLNDFGIFAVITIANERYNIMCVLKIQILSEISETKRNCWQSSTSNTYIVYILYYFLSYRISWFLFIFIPFHSFIFCLFILFVSFNGNHYGPRKRRKEKKKKVLWMGNRAAISRQQRWKLHVIFLYWNEYIVCIYTHYGWKSNRGQTKTNRIYTYSM